MPVWLYLFIGTPLLVVTVVLSIFASMLITRRRTIEQLKLIKIPTL